MGPNVKINVLAPSGGHCWNRSPPPRCLLTSHAFPGALTLPTQWVITSLAPLLLPLPRAPAPARNPALTSLSVPLSTEDFEGENPQVPKLEKSISGTSPKREHLPLAVGIAFFLMTFLAS
ncbi:hypothetical protein P7K49_037413 [Saguinus oedipus]|uniref:Ephrin-A3 n=1 Tax=Saguinus oedipus TaxID=9490 RepID=A0ABQ9THY8_SAGOE|nr:hypothetical protein P7K49_037413 [Saguinus oedipus]